MDLVILLQKTKGLVCELGNAPEAAVIIKRYSFITNQLITCNLTLFCSYYVCLVFTAKKVAIICVRKARGHY